MAGRRSDLAARLRKAVQSERETAVREAEAAEQARNQGRAARDQLLADLGNLGREIGFLEVQPGRDGLTLRYGERYVHFGPIGDSDVRVEFEGIGDDEHRLYRQAELGNRWVYLRKRRLREDRMPLFDQGIEELLVVALGLPRPTVEDDPEASADPPPRKL